MPFKLPLPQWIPPQLTQLVETAPSGPQWLHEIKLDGFRMAARIERGEAQGHGDHARAVWRSAVLISADVSACAPSVLAADATAEAASPLP